MATMYVSWLGGAQFNVAKSPVASETVTTSTVTAKSGAAPAGSGIAMVTSDTAHYVAVGPQATVTATATNGIYVPANCVREIAINPGDGVAAITLA
jgi:hypothetical protein